MSPSSSSHSPRPSASACVRHPPLALAVAQVNGFHGRSYSWLRFSLVFWSACPRASAGETASPGYAASTSGDDRSARLSSFPWFACRFPSACPHASSGPAVHFGSVCFRWS